MRLIHTTNLTLHEFWDAAIPPYAILSHCWVPDGEVTFQQFTSTPPPAAVRASPGYRKITRCCATARAHGYTWAWVDTCCIDKTSSAELSEAINSMWRWYEGCGVCYVFLEDLDAETEGDGDGGWGQLAQCRWFTRGWTLQELLAPREMVFYDARGRVVGTKETLASSLARITGIPRGVLVDATGCARRKMCAAARMSWAATRQTSRAEDTAYCLLGLFDIAMPLLYGEGRARAFRRLQEAIMASSARDESLLAWTAADSAPRGMLADSPAEFARAGNFLVLPAMHRPPVRTTSRGVEVMYNPMNADNGWTKWMYPFGSIGSTNAWRFRHEEVVHFRLACAELLPEMEEGDDDEDESHRQQHEDHSDRRRRSSRRASRQPRVPPGTPRLRYLYLHLQWTFFHGWSRINPDRLLTRSEAPIDGGIFSNDLSFYHALTVEDPRELDMVRGGAGSSDDEPSNPPSTTVETDDLRLFDPNSSIHRSYSDSRSRQFLGITQAFFLTTIGSIAAWLTLTGLAGISRGTAVALCFAFAFVKSRDPVMFVLWMVSLGGVLGVAKLGSLLLFGSAGAGSSGGWDGGEVKMGEGLGLTLKN